MLSDRTSEAAKLGCCGILSVLVPGAVERNIGVIVIDEANQAHLKISEVLFTGDFDILEYWSALAEYLPGLASDLGGREMLNFLHDTGSNFLQVNRIFSCPVDDPEATLASMYRQHVVVPRKQARTDSTVDELGTHRYSQMDISEAMESLPMSSRNALQVIRTFRQSKDPLYDLEKMLSEDPVMAAQIIRLANLSRFSRGPAVRSLAQALQRVGSDIALGYVVALSLRPLYSVPSLRNIWNNSLRCRDAAKMIADLISYRGQIDLPLLALIANIGKVVLIQLNGFERQFQALRRQNYPTLACERILCASDHAEIGADLLADWGLSEDMVAAVRVHHNPSESDSIEAAILLLSEDIAGLDEPTALEEQKIAMDLVGISELDLGSISSALSSEHDGLELSVAARTHS